MKAAAGKLIHTIRPHAAAYFVLLMTMALTFARCLGHDFVYWDDPKYVLLNDVIRGLSAEHIQAAFSRSFVGNYAPVQIISYMLDYQLWGLSPAGFIFTNLFLHFANGMLFYHLCLRLTPHRLAAVIAAFIFLVHPVQVESVAWVSQRKNVLSLFFFLLSFHAFLSFRAHGQRGKLLYVLSVAAYGLALLSKIAAVILPLVILLYDLCLSEDIRSKLRQYGPYLLLSVILAAVAIETQRLTQEGAPVPFYGGTPYQTLLTMTTVLPQYLLNLFWPQFLSIIYSPPVRQVVDGSVLLSLLLVLLLALEGVILYRRKSALFFWYLLFFIGFLPVLQIVPLPTIMQDRYCYYPMLGLAGFIGICADRWITSSATPRRAAAAVMLAAIITLPFLSWKRAQIWRDPVTLISETARSGVGSRYGFYANFADYYLLETCYAWGDALLEKGKTEEALQAYRQVLSIDPLHCDALLKVGYLFLDRHQYRAARLYLEKVAHACPSRFEGPYGLGRLHVETGDPLKAAEAFRQTLQLNPSFVPARNYLMLTTNRH